MASSKRTPPRCPTPATTGERPLIHTFYHDYSRTLQLGHLTLFPICFGRLTLYPNRICARTWTLQGCHKRNWHWHDLRQVIWLQHPPR